MSIISRKPTAPPEIIPLIPKIQSTPAKSVVVDTQYTPRSTLGAYVEGAVYTVDYYSQNLSADMATYGLDPSKSSVYQQYKKIKRLEIRLTEPLSGTQDAQDKSFTIRGAGHIHTGVIPNEGDSFVADVGDGREGVFQVNSSEKRSIFADSVYLVEFQLMFFSSAAPERREDLENKVAATYHYIRDYARWGKNPIVADTRYKCLMDLRELYTDMVRHYFDWFFSKEKGTILLPGQPQTTYDPFIPQVLRQVLSVQEIPQLQHVREWAFTDDNLLSQPTLWTALLRRDHQLLRIANAKMGTVSTSDFSQFPAMRSIRYSGLDRVIYPVLQNESIDTSPNAFSKTAVFGDLVPVPSLYGNVNGMDRAPVYSDPLSTPALYPVLQDDFYVFTSAFYTNIGPKSLLEKLTEDYLQGESIAPEQLHYLASNFSAWGGLERFYYIPVLILLTQSLLRDAL